MTSPESPAVVTAVTTLSATLWRLREALDHLLFKVFETRLVLDADQDRWLPNAGRELDAARREAAQIEIVRAVETLSLADHLGLVPTITLGELSGKLPSPWDTIFLDHLDALRGLVGEIHRAAGTDRRASARPARVAPADEIVDVRAVLADALAEARPASLLAFLA
jgi:hypothetical protein